MICYLNIIILYKLALFSFKLSWLMVWFVILNEISSKMSMLLFQTKLTYGMICYSFCAKSSSEYSKRFKLSWLMVWFVMNTGTKSVVVIVQGFKLSWLMVWFVMDNIYTNFFKLCRFQTKLTYGMICYKTNVQLGKLIPMFQTKLTYGMICYMIE